MNKTVMNFLLKNKIFVNDLNSISGSIIYSKKDINELVDKYGIYSSAIVENVSITEILGYDYEGLEVGTNNIFESLNAFFDEMGDGYHRRSISMLDYSAEDVLIGLEQSFQTEPICLQKLEEGKYFISTNGLHRYSVLKILCLSELVHAQTQEEKDRIYLKYKIPAKVSNVDYIKTYCNYLLNCMGSFSFVWLSNEYDEYYNTTGRSRLDIGDNRKIVTDEELILFIRNNISFISNIDEIRSYMENYESFNTFICTYIPELKNIILEEERKKNHGVG